MSTICFSSVGQYARKGHAGVRQFYDRIWRAGMEELLLLSSASAMVEMGNGGVMWVSRLHALSLVEKRPSVSRWAASTV